MPRDVIITKAFVYKNVAKVAMYMSNMSKAAMTGTVFMKNLYTTAGKSKAAIQSNGPNHEDTAKYDKKPHCP